MLLLHSLGTTLQLWDEPARTLAAGFRVIRMDLRGHGLTEVTPGPYSIAGMARDALAFSDALGLKKLNVVGFSLGGMIAQQLALDHPDRVNRIVLLGTGPRGGEGMTFTELSADERADPERFLLDALFSPTDARRPDGRT